MPSTVRIQAIRQARRKRRLRQLDVAKALGWSEITVCKVETERRGLSPDEAAELAALLGLQVGDILEEIPA